MKTQVRKKVILGVIVFFIAIWIFIGLFPGNPPVDCCEFNRESSKIKCKNGIVEIYARFGDTNTIRRTLAPPFYEQIDFDDILFDKEHVKSDLEYFEIRTIYFTESGDTVHPWYGVSDEFETEAMIVPVCQVVI